MADIHVSTDPRLPCGTRILGGRRQVILKNAAETEAVWMDEVDAKRVLRDHPTEWLPWGYPSDMAVPEKLRPKDGFGYPPMQA